MVPSSPGWVPDDERQAGGAGDGAAPEHALQRAGMDGGVRLTSSSLDVSSLELVHQPSRRPPSLAEARGKRCTNPETSVAHRSNLHLLLQMGLTNHAGRLLKMTRRRRLGGDREGQRLLQPTAAGAACSTLEPRFSPSSVAVDGTPSTVVTPASMRFVWGCVEKYPHQVVIAPSAASCRAWWR